MNRKRERWCREVRFFQRDSRKAQVKRFEGTLQPTPKKEEEPANKEKKGKGRQARQGTGLSILEFEDSPRSRTARTAKREKKTSCTTRGGNPQREPEHGVDGAVEPEKNLAQREVQSLPAASLHGPHKSRVEKI